MDDNPHERFLARTCYESAECSYPWLEFGGAQGLLAYLDEVEVGGALMPALVLCDISMPEVDGFDLVRKLRRRASFEVLPVVVMVTNSERAADREAALKSGARDCFSKPFGLDDYSALLANVVGKYAQGG